MSKIILKKSSVALKVPGIGDLDYGELALNYADGALYYKNSTNNVRTISSSDTVTTVSDLSDFVGTNNYQSSVADPSFGSVTLLLHGSTTDVSSYNRTGTGLSSSTTKSKFANTSILVTGSTRLTYPASSGWNPGSGGFTVEFWINLDALPTGFSTIISNYGTVGTGWSIGFNQTGTLMANLSGDGQDITSVAGVLSTNQWFHVALSGQAGSYKLFCNGVQVGSTFTGSVSVDTSGYPLSVGGLYYQGSWTNLSSSTYYLEDVRITNGVSRYSNNFIPPTSALPGGSSSTATTLDTLLGTKQATLVSGTNIKTINGTSILGSGNISIASGSGDMTKAIYDTDNDGIVDQAAAVPWAGITGAPTFATVATSGDYNDLINTPSLAAVASSGSYTDLIGTPTLATVATSGSYTDLSGTPTFKTINTTAITGSGNISVQPTLVSGINIKSINGISLLGSGDITISGSGSGDMLKATYDTNNDGIVDQAAAVPWSGITSKPTFATVATSGSYTDLSGTPTFKTIDGTSIVGTGDYSVLPTVAAATGDVMGVVDRTASTLSFNDSTRTFTITPVSGSWTFYYQGVLKTVSAAKSVVITNTDGARWIKIDPTTLELVEFFGSPVFESNINLAYIYWDTTTSKGLIIGDERHGSKRDTTWHSVTHSNVGTVWRSGGAITYTLNSDSAVNFGVGTSLVIQDEDLTHTITHSATPTSDYQQILTSSASVPVMYLTGTGTYTATTASTSPWIAGTSLARYNYWNGSAWTLADASEGYYVTYWLVATNDIRAPVKLVLGRLNNATLDTALAEDFTEYGLSFAEQVFMYQIVVKTSSAYTGNSAKVQIAAVRKILSKAGTSVAAVSATTHNSLTGRDAGDSHTIASITNLQSTLNAISPLTTKGDLYTRSSTANVRLPVGGDNLYLAADSTTASGLAWKSISVPAVTYTPSTLVLTNGVYVGGSVTSVQTLNDGQYYEITDGTGAGPAWIITFTFTGVQSFNRIVANVDYTLASGHTVYFQIYNNNTTAWDNIGSYSGSTGYTQYSLGVLEYTPYISSGTVQARLYHSNAGSATHTTKLDYFALEQSTQGAQGPRGATGATGSTGQGVPVGGTTGQALVKSSSTDYATTWADRVISVGGTTPISSSGGTTPSISISQATTTTDGYLSSTDWNTFNNKQAALVSGTNIKTINSTTLLGSGDLAVQATLVSGTNIKTINGNSLLGSGDLTISGGTGSPGGSTTQIQYNNAGAFAGSANFTYDSTANRLALTGTDPEFELQGITTEPAVPSAGRLLIYAKSIGGRLMPKFMGPSGYDTAVQPSIAQNKIALYNPAGNSTTVPVVFGHNLTANGTATARNVATTSVFTRARRIGYVSAATAGQYTGQYNAAAGTQYTVGTGTLGVGGFYFIIRFGISNAVTLASQITFVGVSSTTAAPTVTADPATFTNSIGIGTSSGDTNLRLFYGGSAAQTPIALGASFPGKTLNTDWYELILFAPSNANNTVSYRVQNITSGVMTEGTLTAATPGTQLPASTTLLGIRAYTSNNATAQAVGIDFGTIYMETDT